MELIFCGDNARKRQFLEYRAGLYRGDANSFCTDEFVVKDMICQNTDFARECEVMPVLVTHGGSVVAEAAIIFNPKLEYGQVAFFEAEMGAAVAADMIINEAKRLAKVRGMSKIVIGLNGHVSYGVGILTEGFEYKNSFDSIYNKPYYREYFSHLKSVGLSTYKREKADMEFLLKYPADGVRVRRANMRKFEQEAELMRQICEKTIGKTFLYFPTKEGHFYQLMRDLRPFLKSENLLFAENREGDTIGFLFWHPDFNQMLKGGRGYSDVGLALAYLFKGRKINTAKLNAMGALSSRATVALLNELNAVLGDRFEYVETNFVWDNNVPSTLINKRFFGKPHRRYEVYIDEVD